RHVKAGTLRQLAQHRLPARDPPVVVALRGFRNEQPVIAVADGGFGSCSAELRGLYMRFGSRCSSSDALGLGIDGLELAGTEIVTRAPVFRSVSRMVPQVARSSLVPASPKRCT